MRHISKHSRPTTNTRLPYLSASVGTGMNVSGSTRQMRSGTVATISPSTVQLRFSFWNSTNAWDPLSSAMPSSITLPKLNAPRVSRSTSEILPLNSLWPPVNFKKNSSGERPAAAASSFAVRMARPSSSERVTMPCTP